MINQIVIAGTVNDAIQFRQQGDNTIHFFTLAVPWLDKQKNLGSPTLIQCFTRSKFEQTLQPGNPVIVTGDARLYKNPQRKDAYLRIDFSYKGSVEATGIQLTTNMLCLAGNLGQEPEVKYRENAPTLAKLSLAVKTGKEATEWHNIVAWGKTAEAMQKCLHKGSKVSLTGELKQERWTDKADQSTRAKYSLTVNQFSLLGGSGNGQQKAAQHQATQQAAPAYSDDAF
ncbi:single-stranded DNA-binding protein [Leptolyngbyaceae cyanobacterium CCMR0082]|uniref:Single-stranded DNA-binding protein n=1 Tax=Adonisia turfae CCMR0082 TaxID=2304604 RepID=A0A6M0SAS0_9CYAN|nr:single-stranded DNA-binding protein [Adonisia turfae]NEZ65577.1 single-stranded DNA-binding protein [Adonisia turfae CCMR0082]